MGERLTEAMSKLSAVAKEQKDKEAADQAAARKAQMEKEALLESAIRTHNQLAKSCQLIIDSLNNTYYNDGISFTLKKTSTRSIGPHELRVTLSLNGKEHNYFRMVTSIDAKTWIHEIDSPKYGPFDAGSAEHIPLEEIMAVFIERSIAKPVK